MQKQGKLGVIIGIIIFILVVLGLVVGVILATQKNSVKNQVSLAEEPRLNLYLTGRDATTQESVDADYIVDYTSNGTQIKVSEGKLQKDILTEIAVPKNQLLHVSCWNDDYYMVKASKKFTSAELAENISKLNCDMVKIGKINITHMGGLDKENNVIKLSISVDEWLYRASLAFSWTAGIIDVYSPNDLVLCDKGDWLNWSEYNATSKKFVYYEDNSSRCGDDWIEKCQYTLGNKCRIMDLELPYRFKEGYDSILYLGRNIHNQTTEVTLYVKTLPVKNQLDALTITIFDKDRRWNTETNKFEWMDGSNGEDIGAEDYTYLIKYGS